MTYIKNCNDCKQVHTIYHNYVSLDKNWRVRYLSTMFCVNTDLVIKYRFT
jgi:hypothetical protein